MAQCRATASHGGVDGSNPSASTNLARRIHGELRLASHTNLQFTNRFAAAAHLRCKFAISGLLHDAVLARNVRPGSGGAFAQTTNVPSDAVPAIVGRLEPERFKAPIRGLSQFVIRMQERQRNRMDQLA